MSTSLRIFLIMLYLTLAGGVVIGFAIGRLTA